MAKKSMQKIVDETESGEQMDLIDVAPENAKEIIEKTKLYKQVQSQRLKFLKEETDLKEEIKRLVKVAKLQPLPDGRIKFEHSGFVFCVTPRDELITIKEKKKKKSGKKKKK